MSDNVNASGWSQGWRCQDQGHLFAHGNDQCMICGRDVRATVIADGSNAAFPDVDKVLDHMQALQRARELLDADNGPPDAIRVLAEEHARELGVDVKFMRSVGDDGDLRWRVSVDTKRGRADAVPGLTQEQMVHTALDSDDWKVQGWKNALKAVGLL